MSYVEENKKTLERFIEAIGKENVIDSKIPKEKRFYVTIKDREAERRCHLSQGEGGVVPPRHHNRC